MATVIRPPSQQRNDPLRGPDARLLGQARSRRENRGETLESQLRRWFDRMARLQAKLATQQVLGSQVLQTILKVAEETELERQLRRILQTTGSRAFTAATRRTSRTANAEVTDHRMREFMRTKEVRLQQIMASVRRDVRQSVREIIADSLLEDPRPSTGEIARRIRTTFHGSPQAAGQLRDIRQQQRRRPGVLPTELVRTNEGGLLYAFSPERAALIARTEMAQAEGEGIYEGYRQSGVKGLKWLAYRDGRAGNRRHDLMHGQTVRIGEPFVNETTGNTLRFPGDPMAKIGEVANCRCSVAPVLLEEDF